MIDQQPITHNIQKNILQVLCHQEFAKFSEMRLKNTDSNLYSYHLNKMISSKYVIKDEKGYTLSNKGLQYIEYTSSSSMKIRLQPKIVTAIIIKNTANEIMLLRRNKQPFINYYGLALGKTHSGSDTTTMDAALRELYEKTGIENIDLKHIGDSYLKITIDDTIVSNIFMHVFSGEYNGAIDKESTIWVGEYDLDKIRIIPGIKEIIDVANKSDGHFFSEIETKTS